MTAFDQLAPRYDHDFTQSAIGQYLRGRVQTRLKNLFPVGTRVLELGCGTGEDALFLAENGVQLVATDASEGMLATAQAKLKNQATVRLEKLDLGNLPPSFESQFDGVYANFGVLNCLPEWKNLAAWLAERVKLGGRLGFAVMPPYCLWEMLWHGLHGDFKVATRRFKSADFSINASARMPIYYPTVKRLKADFAPYFKVSRVMPLGLFLPPSDVYGVIEKRPSVLRSLIGLEGRFGEIGSLANFADHYWVELERI